VSGETAEAFLRKFATKHDLGNRTYNHYVQALDEFGTWLVNTRRAALNPFAGMKRRNAEVDIRHRRRALTTEEVARLVNSARTSNEVIQGYDGETRARIYLLSFFTALRRNEIASLTPRSFDLQSDPPTVTVEAAFSKHRRRDVLPLHPEFVAMLHVWLRDADPESPLSPKLAHRKTWLMVKKDLERADIPYETPEGIADFHAAGRHTHITELLRNGATLPEAKELARHSDVKMTMRYTHVGIDDRAKAVGKLPWLRIGCAPCHPNCPEVASNGTDGGENVVRSEMPNPCQGRGYDANWPVVAPRGAPVKSGGGGNRTRKRKVLHRYQATV
jgi:integrase